MFTQILEKTDNPAVDVRDMLTFLNETNTLQRNFVDGLISQATGRIENLTGLAIRPVRMRGYWDRSEIRSQLRLSPSPIQTITTIKMWSEDGTEHTILPATTFFTPGDDRILFTNPFPTDYPRELNALMIEWSALLNPVPEDFIMAIQQLTTHWYDARGITAEVPGSILRLLSHPKTVRVDAIGG